MFHISPFAPPPPLVILICIYNNSKNHTRYSQNQSKETFPHDAIVTKLTISFLCFSFSNQFATLIINFSSFKFSLRKYALDTLNLFCFLIHFFSYIFHPNTNSTSVATTPYQNLLTLYAVALWFIYNSLPVTTILTKDSTERLYFPNKFLVVI